MTIDWNKPLKSRCGEKWIHIGEPERDRYYKSYVHSVKKVGESIVNARTAEGMYWYDGNEHADDIIGNWEEEPVKTVEPTPKIDWSKPLRTKSGWKVENLLTQNEGKRTVHFLEGPWENKATIYTEDGRYYRAKGCTSEYDLENIPEENNVSERQPRINWEKELTQPY